MKKYIIINFLTILIISGCHSVKTNSLTKSRIQLKSLTQSNQDFLLNGKVYTGLAYTTFNSGEIKSEWNILDGKLNGNVIGYHEKIEDSLFRFSYKYTYINGKKCGIQYEYYLKDEKIPFYKNYDTSKPTNLQWIITDFDEKFYGNKDGIRKIDFHQSKGCSYKTDKVTGKLISPTNKECPTGALIVYYERLNLPGYNSKKLFKKCFGRNKCFWRIHRYKNAWYFE